MAKKLVVLVSVLVLFAAFSAHASDLLQLVPGNSAFVLSLNLQRILSTDEIRAQVQDGMAKQTPEQKKAFDEFVQKTGIDPLKSVNNVMIFTSAQIDPATQQPEAGVVIRGTFDIQKILTAIKSDEKAAKDVTITKFEGFDAVRGKTPSDGIGIFIDPQTAAIGSENSLKAVAAVKSKKAQNITANTNFSSLLKRVNTSASIWGAGLLPKEIKQSLMNNPQAAPLAALNAIFFSFDYDKNLNFNFTGEVDDPKAMEGIMTSLNGFLAMIKMIAGQTPEAAEILNMIRVSSAGTAAQIELSVSKAKLDEIRQKIEQRMQAPGN